MLTLDIDIFLGIGVMHGCVYIHQISIYRYQSLLNLSLTQTYLSLTQTYGYEDLVMWVSLDSIQQNPFILREILV